MLTSGERAEVQELQDFVSPALHDDEVATVVAQVERELAAAPASRHVASRGALDGGRLTGTDDRAGLLMASPASTLNPGQVAGALVEHWISVIG